MKVELIQPWSVPLFRTTLPPDVLQTMIEITDQVIADKESISQGDKLVGQIEKELYIDVNLLHQTGVQGFFTEALDQFVLTCKYQQSGGSMPTTTGMMRGRVEGEWLTEIVTMWVVSQQPGEYNPLHAHSYCQISTVMYLKVPKMLPSRKKGSTGGGDDGCIHFTSNCSRDLNLSVPGIIIPPQVGDFYIFGAEQLHAVYPFRCKEGQEDVERRSISFNVLFEPKTGEYKTDYQKFCEWKKSQI